MPTIEPKDLKLLEGSQYAFTCYIHQASLYCRDWDTLAPFMREHKDCTSADIEPATSRSKKVTK